MHRLRFRRWLKARKFVDVIDDLSIKWNPLRIHYDKHERCYILEYESANPNRVTAIYLANIKDYRSYK